MKQLSLFLLLFGPFALWAQIDINQPWKFITGDDPAYARPDVDDSRWASISVSKNWEDQGYSGYNGYAWYRFHFRVPAAWRGKVSLPNALRVQLGRIDDVDAVYLNGQKVGQTGQFPEEPGGYSTAWDVRRHYLKQYAAADFPLRWDADNVLAVRVYDGGGGGGFFETAPRVFALAEVTDFIQADGYCATHPASGADTIRAVFNLKNQYSTAIDGHMTLQIEGGGAKKPVLLQSSAVQLAPGETKTFQTTRMAGPPSRITLIFKEKKTGKTLRSSLELPYILTPPESPKPQLHNPGVYGARPGAPFLYAIAATGQRPVRFGAKGLPAGLRLDERSGVISGTTPARGMYSVTLEAANSLGSATKVVNLIVGDNICLTPPLGWNSWNCWGLSVSDERVRASTDAMVNSGLTHHGWTYMNIDDGWEAPERDPKTGEIRCNEKFPDMKALADYVHKQGMKIGIYSSPGPRTCGGYLGTWQHEAQDAQSWANWGIDYIKYDWCSYTEVSGKAAKDWTREDLQKPYRVMRAALDKCGRDIAYSLCQYGMGDVWEWGADVGGNLWRTTGDITDTWESLQTIGFSQDKAAPYARPGHWNDPDMLIVGLVGWGDKLHPTRLTPSEQYTHISLWALLSAPLLIGCDLARLDDFTYNLLANDEVLAIDQDIAGKSAVRRLDRDGYQVWVKALADGSHAVGIFNLTETERSISINWSEVNLSGYSKIRDVWRQRDLGKFGKSFSARVPAHGVQLVRVY